ncbi:hypothetical protein [Mycobacterium lepromatosis]|uniref:hypothetical protein n=1 Tax=Mycobacterium lepromatosis TaxID=480418 RepID=UPI001EDAE718|nr:hypothetical protein [Mycobacterium lepromatosis]
MRLQFGGYRYIRNRVMRTLKKDIICYCEVTEEVDKPNFAGLRECWNQVKDAKRRYRHRPGVVDRDQQEGVRRWCSRCVGRLLELAVGQVG